MKNLFVARIKDGKGNATTNLYGGIEAWRNYHRDTFSPLCETEAFILLEINGKTYEERKECVRNLAIAYSNTDGGGLSWGELAEINTWFEKAGKRYGLLAEFRENAIC